MHARTHTHTFKLTATATVAAKLLQSCPTLCNPLDGSPLGFTVPGILQARTLDRAAIFFSSAWKWKVKVKSLSRVQLFATPWTAAHLAPLPMGFSRQEYWSGVPLPSPSNSLYYFILQATHFLKNTKTLRTIFVFFIQVIFLSSILFKFPIILWTLQYYHDYLKFEKQALG